MVLSVVMHGATVTPVMRWIDRRRGLDPLKPTAISSERKEQNNAACPDGRSSYYLPGNGCAARKTGILAMDAIALMDGLGIERFSVVGHDWGSHIAECLAIGWPDRVERIAQLSSTPRMGGLRTPPFRQSQLYWYQWFMATKRGAEAIAKDRKGFARIQWENWAPNGWFDEATFKAVAKSFENPDWLAVTLHSYRVRWEEAEPDPASDWLERKVKEMKQFSIPAMFVHGEKDGVTPAALSENVHQTFTGPFERILLQNVGHFPQREDPETVARELALFLDA